MKEIKNQDELAEIPKVNRLKQLIFSLRDHADFGHSTRNFEVVETHISYVLLTGDYAYKFKKPVNLGFLDFSTLEKRKFYCEEEVRLNRRFAPEIYLDVIAITGTTDYPAVNGEGDVLEYSVKMVQFTKGSELAQILKTGKLMPSYIDEMAKQISKFHQAAAIAPEERSYGVPKVIQQTVLDNFISIRASKAGTSYKVQLDRIEQWTVQTFEKYSSFIGTRKLNGFIRECHGDLHLGNIILYEDKPMLFDCIEFSNDLRWIDEINEIAFLVMDLDAHGASLLSHRLLNDYLEIRGDYEGLRLLPYYYVYRAMVRCKIACIRLEQHELKQTDKEHEGERFQHYLDLAWRYIQPTHSTLFITHGFSGSGKTTLTQQILEKIGAIRVRSDVQRKRLHGLDVEIRTASALQSGIYSRSSTEKTYDQLLSQAKYILKAGYSAIIDATFLKETMRSKFRRLADDLNIPFLILDFQAEEADLRRRVKVREREGKDASEAGLNILEYQLSHCEPLTKPEISNAVVIDTSLLNGDREMNHILQEISALTGVRAQH